MACSGIVKAVACGGVLLLAAAAAAGQDNQWIVLQEVEVELAGNERLVLRVPDGGSYQLAGLRVLHSCERFVGQKREWWACGEASRRSLQGAIRGEKLDCVILAPGDRPAVECMAQTRNLNLWMVRRPGVEVVEEWRHREGFSRYATADREGRETRELARALARIDPLKIASTRDSASAGDAVFADAFRADDSPWKTVALDARAERRGATVAERRVIARGLTKESLRAGVWQFRRLRLIVGEDPESCLQYIWCRFAVVDAAGNVLVAAIARGAPQVAVADGQRLFGMQWLALVWEDPGGVWRQWRHY